MIPVVMPDNSMPGLPSAFTNNGTNGGLQIADTEVIIKVSLSTPASLHNRACSSRLPATVPNIKW